MVCASPLKDEFHKIPLLVHPFLLGDPGGLRNHQITRPAKGGAATIPVRLLLTQNPSCFCICPLRCRVLMRYRGHGILAKSFTHTISFTLQFPLPSTCVSCDKHFTTTTSLVARLSLINHSLDSSPSLLPASPATCTSWTTQRYNVIRRWTLAANSRAYIVGRRLKNRCS